MQYGLLFFQKELSCALAKNQYQSRHSVGGWLRQKVTLYCTYILIAYKLHSYLYITHRDVICDTKRISF